MKRVEFTIPIEPKTKKNSQKIIHGKNGGVKIVQSEQYRRYVRDTALILASAKTKNDIRKPISEPVHIRALFYRKTKRIVDLTNLQECLHDVLVGCGILEDDSCRIIVSTDGSRVRYDKKNPRTEVAIEPVTDPLDHKEWQRMMPE